MMHPSGRDWARVDELTSTVLINDFHSDHVKTVVEGTPRSFPQFSRLPTEIAFIIWWHVLQKHRLISITVTDKARSPFWETDDLQTGEENSLGRAISGKNYKLQTNTHHISSPLLRTSCGSRQAALEFYRVHIPYDRKSYGERRCIYINPNFDFVHVKSSSQPEVLAHFVHDLKAYDPQGIGVFNLGIGADKPYELKLPLDSSVLPPHVLLSFTTVISCLHRVFFHSVARWDSRVMFDSLGMEEVRFNHSYPILASTEAFDIAGPDPRPIDGDLDKVAIGCDPRSMPCLWNQMERNFAITREPGTTEFVYHITTPAFGQHSNQHSAILSRAEAIKTLQREQDAWHSRWEQGGFLARNGYNDPNMPEKLRNAPMPAFGFWILPIDAFGEIPEEEFENIRRWEMKMVVNLKNHWPQLGVFRLSPGE